MNLTKNFTLEEFVRSDTARRLGIDNTPNEVEIRNMRNLAEKVLQPLRDKYGAPITISSGYRGLALNRAVGGTSSSQHLTGEAADLRCRDAREAILLSTFIISHGIYDQLILEHSAIAVWLHVSCKPDIRYNRKEVKVMKK